MHKVGDLIGNRPFFWVNPTSTVREAVRFMSEKQVGAVPVLDADKLVGIFSERDLMSRVVAPGKNPDQVTIAEVMTREVLTADFSDSTHLCLRRMQQARCRHLPVLRSGKLVGTVSLREMLMEDLAEKSTELAAIKEYIQGA